MPRLRPLPPHPAGNTVAELIQRVQEFAASPVPDNDDARVQHLSDLRHLQIAVDAAFEQQLVECREAFRDSPGSGRGLEGLGQRLGMGSTTIQRVVDYRPAARLEAARTGSEVDPAILSKLATEAEKRRARAATAG